VVATIDGDASREYSSPRLDRELLKSLVRSENVTKVAVASGPGSFTGLRVGVSFGLGLAIGLQIPIVPLPTLELQAARSRTPCTAVVEAGRGRYYHMLPGQEARLAEPAAIPATYPLAGNVADRRSLLAAGHRFVPENELRTFAEAAEILLRTAPEVPYRNLEIEYMQSFSSRKR
jgi:tRNA A37 threonylcarbamoyladenosine modification protein TsaB